MFNKVPLQIAVAFSLIIRELTVPSPAQTDKHSQNKSCAYTNTQINYTSEEVLFLIKKTSEKHSSTSKLHRSPNAWSKIVCASVALIRSLSFLTKVNLGLQGTYSANWTGNGAKTQCRNKTTVAFLIKSLHVSPWSNSRSLTNSILPFTRSTQMERCGLDLVLLNTQGYCTVLDPMLINQVCM